MKNLSSNLIIYLIILFLIIIYVPAVQANLLNHNYQINAIVAGTIGVSTIVDVINPSVVISCLSPTSVGPDCGLNVNNGGYSVSFLDTDIIINTSASTSGQYGQNDFITFLILDPGFIFKGASLSSTNIPGLTSQRVTFTASAVTLNLSGLSAPANESIDLSVQVGTGFAGAQMSTFNPFGVSLSILDPNYNGLAMNNLGTINISTGGIIVNDVSGDVENGGLIDNSGIVENLGIVNNNSILTNEVGAVINGSGTISNLVNGEVDNSGTIQNSGTVQNSGTIQNINTFLNALNALVQNEISGYVNNTGTIYQQGALRNLGSMTNNTNATIDNQPNAVITNSGTLQNDGTINNNGSISNSGNLVVSSGGSITGTGTFDQTSGAATVSGQIDTSVLTIINGLLQISSQVSNNQAKVVINSIPP